MGGLSPLRGGQKMAQEGDSPGPSGQSSMSVSHRLRPASGVDYKPFVS